MKQWIKDLIGYALIIVAVILVRTYLVTPVKVSGESMSPTLSGTEIMMLNKLGEVDRYDIVVVEKGEEKIIKRVYGLPGEKIQVLDNKIYINDQEITDNYGDGNTNDTEAITLGKDEYFVLGDNREDSLDSRILGPIKASKIMGTTKLVIYPLGKFGNVD